MPASVKFALLVAVASAIRTNKKSNAVPGEVTSVYALGSPATARPALTNPKSSGGCWEGLRMWTKDGWWVDLVTTITNVLGFKHPQLQGVEANVGKSNKAYACDSKVPDRPSGLPGGNHDLHHYVKYSEQFGTFAGEAARVGAEAAVIQNEAEAAAMVAAEGWNLVGYAYHPGKTIFGGPQPSLLIQNPSSLECLLTFQSTQSTKDWLNNLLISKVSFCGLSQKVHKGFRDHLRRIVKTQDFKSNILAKLSGCAKVHTVGHSKGGAMAELFSACANSDNGSDDHSHMAWTAGAPRDLAR